MKTGRPKRMLFSFSVALDPMLVALLPTSVEVLWSGTDEGVVACIATAPQMAEFLRDLHKRGVVVDACVVEPQS